MHADENYIFINNCEAKVYLVSKLEIPGVNMKFIFLLIKSKAKEES